MTAVDTQKIWQNFAQKYALTDYQLEQFKQYYALIKQWNSEVCNLTTITELSAVIHDHFKDSLSLIQCFDLTSIKSLADVGTGAGFPALPLKIVYPHLEIYLIEVTHKKREFLAHVIKELKLENITIIELDWRTFLRKTDYAIDLFCSRAALQTEELIRLFKPSCVYNNSTLVYWAARNWEPTKKELPYISQECSYSLGNKKRRLIFFARQSSIELNIMDRS